LKEAHITTKVRKKEEMRRENVWVAKRRIREETVGRGWKESCEWTVPTNEERP
jgi:hypothetical protein